MSEKTLSENTGKVKVKLKTSKKKLAEIKLRSTKPEEKTPIEKQTKPLKKELEEKPEESSARTDVELEASKKDIEAIKPRAKIAIPVRKEPQKKTPIPETDKEEIPDKEVIETPRKFSPTLPTTDRAIKGSLREKLISIFKKPKKIIYPFLNIKDPRHLIILPKFDDLTKVDFRYPLLEPYIFAHLKWNEKRKKIIYNIEEPQLSKEEKEILATIEKNLVEIIDVEYSIVKEKEKLITYLQKKVATLLEETGEILSTEEYIKIMYYVIRDFVGMNEIEPLFHDPYIEDIGCDGLNVPIFLIHRRFGSIETNVVFDDDDYLSNFVVKLAERCGRYISYAEPLLDGSLPDGSRIQASFAKDVTTRGPTFSIRKFRKNPYSPIDMIRLGTASFDIMAYIWFLIENDTSILICGGVSTGKTTMLNALSTFIPPEDKIVSIEDTRELNLPHNNWIPSVSRTGFGMPEASGKKYGEIDLFDLLKESFRQNPDYVIVGEVRGKEAYVMFQGMASGHPTIGTIHAGSVSDVIKRLETPPINLSPTLIDSLDLLIVMTNAHEKGKSSRRMKEVVEIQSIDKNTGKAHSLKTFGWVPSVDKFRENVDNSEILHRISFDKGIPMNTIKNELIIRNKFFMWLDRHDVTDFNEVAQLINLYYKDKPIVLKWIDSDMNPYQTLSREKVKRLWETSTGLKLMN
ncbi:MAG: type II/IV secretion system ATPase subunit [Nanoarchaeota archaeon]|nr:type II/IV secretion system ATPase subunit [Nanoarchaeota archaeon]